MSIFKKTSGFLLINKPPGPTSHDVIDELRHITGIRQIGHAGTLDPFASGLLLIGIGEATKLLRHYVGLDKEYVATLRLGAMSNTYDRTGKIVVSCQLSVVSKLTNKKIQRVLKSFLGKQKQVPPMYSAKKVGGKKLYELARAGKEIKRKLIDIEIKDLSLTAYDLRLISPKFQSARGGPNTITLSCKVSSGTYIRSLAHDIGKLLGAGAYLEELTRTAIGDFKLKDAISIPVDSPSSVHAPSTLTLPSPWKGEGGQKSWLEHLIPIKTVLVAGTFDGVHEGHRDYFQQARQFGQKLIAIVARDEVAEKFKGRLPKHSAKERIKMVKEWPEIDQVFLGVPDDSPDRIFDFVASLKPDIIALGYDQTAYTENLETEMKKRGLKVKIIRLKPYYPKKYKSSIITAPELTKNKTSVKI